MPDFYVKSAQALPGSLATPPAHAPGFLISAADADAAAAAFLALSPLAAGELLTVTSKASASGYTVSAPVANPSALTY